MAKPTSRPTGQLLAGLLVGAVSAIAWAVRRGQPIPAGPPPTGGPQPASPESASMPADAQPPVASGSTARARVRAFRGLAFVVCMAGVVALTLVIARAGEWRLPLTIAAGVLVITGCVFVFPRLLAPTRVPADLAGIQELSAKDRIQLADDRRRLQNDVRTVLLQAVAGAAVLVGVLFTWQQQQATLRQQQITIQQLDTQQQIQVSERFSRAIGQLGSASIDVRLGGLYELEQLARQAHQRRLVIIEVVAAYIREHARPPANAAKAKREPPSQDVAAALTIIERRSIQTGDPQVDLRRADFGSVDLSSLALHSLDRDFADFHGVNLAGVNLGGADLYGVSLHDTDLDGANLAGADLTLANLRDTSAFRTDLRNAHLKLARLNRASLSGADLSGADLSEADLSGSGFLDGADLIGANLRRANLRGANLRGASLFAADLRGANLHDTDLHMARANKLTQWPEKFDWRHAGMLLYS
jgi:uncharacterized protein YjbI with pentapeptide repeats